MSGGVTTWKEQMVEELKGYQKREEEQVEKLIRLNTVEGLLEEGKAMWKFLFSGTDETDFELYPQVQSLHDEYRILKTETDRYNNYFLENSLEKDYYEGLRKQDVTALAAVQKEGFHKAEYALAYIMLCMKNNRKGADYLIELANVGDAYAMFRLGEFYEYRAVNEIGTKACSESIKEAKKWYGKASDTDNKLREACLDGNYNISRIEEVHAEHMKKINHEKVILKLIKILGTAAPIAICFFMVLWAGLQAPKYLKRDARYSVDGRIYVSDPENSVPGKIYGVPVIINSSNVKELIIADGTKIIPKDLYRDYTSLEKLVIPEGVERIEEGAFSGCTKLSEISFPSTLRYIGREAFFNCTSLKSINAGGTALKNISSKAFCGCAMLEKITLPPSCMTAGDAFLGSSTDFNIDYVQ